VEIAPGIGLADAIFDIVSTGSTLLTNGLKEVKVVVESEAVLIANNDLNEEKRSILDKLVFRVKSVLRASENKYITLNAPRASVPEIIKLLPGMKSPTIVSLAEEGWCGIHAVVKEDEFWDIIDKMKRLGAEGILVIPIEKMIL
jgi:ATP phosphoribosyltransferase